MSDPTIRDVARHARVSVASVSRALNGHDNVSEATRARVADAVRALSYVPHAGARSLSLARNNAIGVVLPDLHGEFFSEIVRGMDREASRHGFLLLLSNLHAGSAQAASALRAMRGRVDGLVVMAPHLRGEELCDALPAGLPAVLVNTRATAPSRAAIHIDNAVGTRSVIAHFAALGRKRLLHISGPKNNVDSQERADACRAAAEEFDLSLEVVRGDFEEESGRAAVDELIVHRREFDAVFAANDNMAIGAIGALRQVGLRIPEDVAVAGFDDIPLSRHLGLTTVRVRIAELGERALAMLLELLSGSEPGEERHTPELVVRSTTQLDQDP
ncbi:MAG: LacI family DNA-binding transcriptional regulator [Alphaproteobacteria bacterium]